MAQSGVTAMAPAGSQRPLGIALLIGLTLAWGLNWPFMKIALSEIPVWQFRAVSTGFAAAALFLLARLSRQSMAIPRQHWPILVVAALINITSWHLLIAFGVKLMPSGQAAILGFTMPIWAAILGSLILKEALTLRRIAGLSAGLAAILLLSWRELADIQGHLLGVGLILLGAFNWAVGTIIQKRVKWTISSIPLAGWQLSIGVVPIIIVAFFDGPFVWHLVSWEALGSAAYLTIVAMVFAYYAWFRIVTIFPASVAAIGTLLVPVVALLSGALILGEAVGWREAAALVLAVFAVAIVIFDKAPDSRRDGQRT